MDKKKRNTILSYIFIGIVIGLIFYLAGYIIGQIQTYNDLHYLCCLKGMLK